MPMQRLTARTSTILISLGSETQVFRSVAEVPAPLRRKLKQSTQGPNAGTILIADKGGREEIARALDGQSNAVQCRVLESVTRGQKQRRKTMSISARTWLELLLPIALGASLWFLIESRF